MKYRTVSVYPQVDQQLNKAIELIATGQLSAKQAMQQAQAGVDRRAQARRHRV